MSDINKVLLIGRLGDDPDEYSSDGRKIASFSLATNRRWKDGSGRWHNKTDWHRVSAFGYQAEKALDQFCKGSRVYVEGRIQTDEVESDYGEVKKYMNVVAQAVSWVSGPKRERIEVEDIDL